MNTHTFNFPLSIQTVLPENYRENKEFQDNLRTLQHVGFYGVELNIARFDKTNFADIQDFLQEFDLTMTMFASGLTAKTEQLSLSSEDPAVRKRSVRRCQDMIDFVEGTGAGIIVGFLKGGVTQQKQHASDHFKETLQAISPYAADKQVKILIEATNRYESSVANSLEESAELIKDLDHQFMRILPDTFHINIEEADGFKALQTYSALYDSIHISDNNRFFPGFGAIKFEELFQFLKSQQFSGSLAIEGNIKESFVKDVTVSINYLKPLLS
jgi:sugar phosphate isomerase/epimerase